MAKGWEKEISLCTNTPYTTSTNTNTGLHISRLRFPPTCVSANKQRGPLSNCGTEIPCIPLTKAGNTKH